MKILFLSQIVPYPPKGGVLQRSYNILREICYAHEVHLMAFIHPDVLDTNEKIMKAKHQLLLFCKSVEFFPLRTKQRRRHYLWTLIRSLFSLNPFSVLALKSTDFQDYIKKLMIQHTFDIIHFDTIALAQYLPQVRHVPRTMTHHNIESVLMLRRARVERNLLSSLYMYINGLKILRYEKKYSNKFNCNITCSNSDKDLLLKIRSGLRVEIIPNGVDTSFFNPLPEDEKEGLIVHIGAMQSANLDGMQYFLNEIWPLVKKKKSVVRLKIVGGSVPDTLRKNVFHDKDITLTGYVDDIRPYIAEASLIIVPLRYGGGTKLKVLDSLAMGKAVVSTSIGIEGIDVTPGKDILVADRPSEFADGILFLLDNTEYRKRLGRAGRELIEEKYSWDLIGCRQRDLYAKIYSGEYGDINESFPSNGI